MRSIAKLTLLAVVALLPLTACEEKPAADNAPNAQTPKGQVPPPADVAAAPADAQKLPSGATFKILQAGTGNQRPELHDSARLNYTGWTPDGAMFGSTNTLGRPARVGLAGIHPAFSESLSGMVVGEKRRVWVPSGGTAEGWPEPPQGPFVIDLELLEVIPGTKPVAVPEDVAEPPKDALRTPTGLFSRVLQPGKGKIRPKRSDVVKVDYSGWTTDGKMFDSSVTKGAPATFPLDGVIEGWSQGVPLMVEGEKRRFWIPEELAYKGIKGKPQGMLVFDVELLEIVRPPSAPPDVARPPQDAQKTSTGLATKVLQPGKGTQKPTATSRVRVQYTGWTTDGKMFDSSVTRGQPATFALTEVIAGWTEALQLMVEGEKRRLWIPQDIAYKGKRGKPKGMLVFDVELLEIVSQ